MSERPSLVKTGVIVCCDEKDRRGPGAVKTQCKVCECYWHATCADPSREDARLWPQAEAAAKPNRRIWWTCHRCVYLAARFEEERAAASKKKPKARVPCTWPGCTLDYSTRQAMDLHRAVEHEGKRFNCERCGRPFRSPGKAEVGEHTPCRALELRQPEAALPQLEGPAEAAAEDHTY